MQLKLWLVKHRKTVKEFADEIGYARSYVSKVALGHMKPGKRLAKAIEEATGGEITAGALMRLKKPAKGS